MRRFGTIGHMADPSMSLAAVMGTLLSMRHGGRTRRATPIRTPEQIAAAEKRSERQRWNDAVDARKAAKKAGQP